MALDKDIAGSIEFLEALGLEGSTHLLKGPNGEQVELNQSEINEENEFEVGEEYSFFIHPDYSGKLFATQNMPDITKDKYDFAKILKTDRDGARVDVGLPREMLIPWEDLPKVKSLWPQSGDYVLATLRIDRNHQMFARLVSETIAEKMFTPVSNDDMQNQVLKARPHRLLRIGTFLLIEDDYKVLVHESERKHKSRLGEAAEVRIIGHNEKGELNGLFLPLVHERLDEDGQVISDLLVEYDGELSLWDRPSPEAIKGASNMSKGSSERATGHLYKRKIINIETGKITLTKKDKTLIQEQ